MQSIYQHLASYYTTSLLALVVAGAFGLAGCDAGISSPDLKDTSNGSRALLHTRPGVDPATIPLKGQFFTDRVQDEFPAPERCGPFDPENGQFNLLNLQAGSGHLRGVGPVQVNFEFCVDVADFFDDDPGLQTGIPYFNGTGTFTARNGDQLFSTAEGIVLPSDDPQFDFEFHDTQTFTGGTGRFADISGFYTFNSKVDNDFTLEDGTVVSRTFHRITGYLTRVETGR